MAKKQNEKKKDKARIPWSNKNSVQGYAHGGTRLGTKEFNKIKRSSGGGNVRMRGVVKRGEAGLVFTGLRGVGRVMLVPWIEKRGVQR